MKRDTGSSRWLKETSHLINVLHPTIPAKKALRLVIKLSATVAGQWQRLWTVKLAIKLPLSRQASCH